MKLRILIAEDEEAARFGMVKALSSANAEILEAEDGEAAIAKIRESTPHLIFLDLNMPKLDGIAVLETLANEPPETTQLAAREIIVVTADDAISSAITCMRLGATDYITKPYEVEQLRGIARRNQRRVDLEARVESLQDKLDQETAFGSLVGASPAMRSLFAKLPRAAKAPLDILLRGETGTGKELIAREIHRLSDHSAGPFVAVNAAAISETLAETTLFGHKKGAFTGATSDHDGLFAQAEGGTVFLDEIGDMPLTLQTKVLRVLQERELTPVGSTTPRTINVRVISATHQDLEQAIEDGHFRRDLYYRIKGIDVRIPPLRERREDVLLLADHFIEQLRSRPFVPVSDGEHSDEFVAPKLDSEAQTRLLTHNWPGNVRELSQLVTAAAAMNETGVITARELSLERREGNGESFLAELDGIPLTEAKTRLVEWFERRAVSNALAETDDNISAAARRLGIHRQSLQQKMAQLGIKRRSQP